MSKIKMEKFMDHADAFFSQLLKNRSFFIEKQENISCDCIGYRCEKKGRMFTVYMFAFSDKKISHLDGEFCSQLRNNPLSKDSAILIAYLQVKTNGSEPQICDYTGNPDGEINFCRLTDVQGKPVLLFYPDENIHQLLFKMIDAFNSDNADLYHCIFSEDVSLSLQEGGSKDVFRHNDVYHNLKKLHEQHGKMKIGYIRFNDAVYSRVAYLDGYGYFGIGTTDDYSRIQLICRSSFENPKILEFIKTEEPVPYSACSVPLAKTIVPLPKIQSERFAMKICYANGECLKYVLPIESEDEEAIYDSHVFTDQAWAGGKLTASHKSLISGYPDGGQAIEFSNGYYLPILECYEKGTVYTEPVMRNIVIYSDKEWKITKLWDWNVKAIYEDNGRLTNDENEKGTGLLKVLLYGDSFNVNGVSTIMHKDGTRCSLDFSYLDNSSSGWFPVRVFGHGYSFINSSFEFINKIYYDNAGRFSGKYASVARDGENFCINREGKEIAVNNFSPDTKYVRIERFSEGLARATVLNISFVDLAFYSESEDIAGIWGYIDETGKEIIAPQYIYANDFKNGIAVVCKGKWENKNWLHRGKYHAGCWSKEEKWGAIDKSGKEAIPFIFDELEQYDEEGKIYKAHYGGYPDGKYGLIDCKGNWIVKPIFGYISYSYEHGMLVFSENELDEKNGVYDVKEQKILLNAEYHDIDFCSNGDICVETFNEKTNQIIYKVLDRNCKEKFSYECSFMYDKTNADKTKRYFLLSGNGGHGLADAETGKIIFEPDPKWAEFFIDEQRIKFVKNGKTGICDFKQRVIADPEYDDIGKCLCHGFYEVKVGKTYMEDARYGLIKMDGTAILPPKYLDICFCMDEQHIICKEETGCSLLRLDRNA